MTCTFDESLPSPKDRIRLLLGDTGDPCLRSDETINALVAAVGEAAATAELAAGLAIYYAQQPDAMSADGATISYRARVEAMRALAKTSAEAAAAASGRGGTTSARAMRDDDCLGAEYRRPEWWSPCPPGRDLCPSSP